MKKVTILCCAILLAFTLHAQEKRMIHHFKNGDKVEIPINTLDSITFYTHMGG